MIDTSEWPSPFENTPELDELPWDAEDQRLAMGAGVQIVECDASTEECTSCGGCEDKQF